jgi:protein-L-isoaspartate(D-aspartate) O-methyltransferase
MGRVIHGNQSAVIESAMLAMPREHFMPLKTRRFAGLDAAAPIGHGQTISQPYTVKKMLEWLAVEKGNRVLDVGSGSGWTTAILSRLVGADGYIYAVEIVPELLAFGKRNCEKLGIRNASFYAAGSTLGLPEFAPYDRILVSAAATEMKQELTEQLKPGGKLVLPVQNDIVEVSKDKDGRVQQMPHSGFAFVPLRSPVG